MLTPCKKLPRRKHIILLSVMAVLKPSGTTFMSYTNKKTVLSQGNRAMPQLFFSV